MGNDSDCDKALSECVCLYVGGMNILVHLVT